MANTPILSAPQVAANQNQKETTMNTAMAVFEGATQDQQTLSLASGNRTLTTTQFTRFFHTTYTGHTVPRTVTIPNTVRFFAVRNDGTDQITFHVNGSSGQDLIVPADKRVLVYSNGVDVLAISEAVSLLSDLSDVVGAADASEGQLLGFSGGVWGPVDNPSDHDFYHAGAPTADKVLYKRIFVRNARLLSDFSGSFGNAEVAATAETVIEVYKNATLVGEITFAASATTPTFTTDVGAGSATVTFAPGDVLTIKAPTVPDATLAGILVTLKGVLF